MWPFKRKSRSEPQTYESPRARDELLLGDNNTNWVIPDFMIHPKLLGLYDEIDSILSDIFSHGSLDANNSKFLDGFINSTMSVALQELNGQNSLTPTRIEKMVAWRERDINEISGKIQSHSENHKKSIAKLEALQERLNESNFKSKKRGNYNEKK